MSAVALGALSRQERAALCLYAAVTIVANLVWETAQMPLYTLWQGGTTSEIVFAVLHCTGGDLLIALFCLAIAILLGGGRKALQHPVRVGLLTAGLGLAYTMFSEWLNIDIRQSWAYAPAMPVLPWLGTGLSPLAQWLLIPPLALWPAYRTLKQSD